MAHRVQRLLILVQPLDQFPTALGAGQVRAQLVHVELVLAAHELVGQARRLDALTKRVAA